MGRGSRKGSLTVQAFHCKLSHRQDSGTSWQASGQARLLYSFQVWL